MDIQTRITIVQAFFAFAALAFAWFYAARRTRLDEYREDLFTLRDELFDFMWQNGHDFDVPAYRMLRQILNGAIRGAGLLSPFSVLCLALAYRRRPEPPDPLAAALNDVADDSLRNRLRACRTEFLERTLRFVFGEGALGVPVRLLRRLHWFQQSLRARVVRPWLTQLAALAEVHQPLPGMATAR